jgi:patatin-like phospholipase/acyl hydrolase
VLWLERLERHLNGPVHGHFDLIAGTSVGAILGCGFAMGMTATEARTMWVNGAHIAFAKPHTMKERGRRLAAKAGLMPKYESAGLEALLRSIFQDCRMGDLTPPTLALSYDIQRLQVHVFSSEREEHKRLPVWEVCRASTAAPLFWDPHLMSLDDTGVRHPMADGGVTANNPVILAISESVSHAKGTGKTVQLDNVVVASFGTGAPPEGQTEVPKTIFGHGSMIMRALMTGATGTDHVTARTMLPAHNYWRFQTSISARLAPLDDIENIDELQAVALAQLADGTDQRLCQLTRRLQGKRLDKNWWEGNTKEEAA